jgi:hypothetical protein
LLGRNALLASAFLGVPFLPGEAQQQQTVRPLAGAPSYEQVMTSVSRPFLDQRYSVMKAVRTKEQAQSRQAYVRATVRKLLGDKGVVPTSVRPECHWKVESKLRLPLSDTLLLECYKSFKPSLVAFGVCIHPPMLVKGRKS